MAKDRIEICKSYVCEHECLKGKDAEHKGLCQRCKSYEARSHTKHMNKKKTELDKIRDKEWRKE